EFTDDIRQLGFAAALHAVALALRPCVFLAIGRDGGLDHFWREQVPLQGRQDALLDMAHAYGAALPASAAIRARGAAQIVAHGNVVAGATAAAVDETGEQALRPALLIEMRPAPRRAQALHRLPEFLVDDAQLGHVLAHPFALRVGARDALAGGGVLEEALTVVDDGAAVELVVEQAVAALGRADQGGDVPGAAAGPGLALAVEIAHDGQRAFTGGVLGIDALDDGGFPRIDDAASAVLTGRHHIVAVAPAAGDATRLDTADLAPPGLLGEVLQEQGRHGALEPDVDLGDMAIG